MNFWNIPLETAQFLYFLVNERRYKTILEIGTSNGYSASWLARALARQRGRLYTLESHRERFALAAKNLSKFKNVTLTFGHAPESIPQEPYLFDMVFLDATKYEYQAYFKTIKNRVKKGGLIVADNSNSHKKDLATYFKLLKSTAGWSSYNLNLGSGLYISLRK